LTSHIQKHINHRRFRPFKLLLTIFVLFSIVINAQEDDFEVENFFIDEGLPNTRVKAINQDESGLIWLCLSNQLYTFNGSQFEFQLDFKNNNPEALLFDNNGNKWIYQVSPLVAEPWNTKIKETKIYDKNNQEIDLEEYLGINDPKIDRLYQGKEGIISIQIGSTFYAFDKKVERLNFPEDINKNCYISKNLAVITKKSSSYIFDRNTNEIIHHFKDINCVKGKYYNELIYLYFSNGVIQSFDPDTKSLKMIRASAGNEDPIRFMEYDDWGNLWLLKKNNLYLNNIETKKEINFTKGHKYPSLPYNISAFKDREDNIWVGTNTGLNRIYRKPKALFENSGKLNYSTRNITQLTDNELFVSTYSGNYIYDLETFEYQLISDLNVITGMLEEDGYYYSISRQMQFRKDKISSKGIENQKLYAFQEKYKYGRFPGTLLKLSNGKKYLLLYHTIYEFDNDLNRKAVLENKSNTVFYHCAHEVNNEIYVLTNKGINIYDLGFNFKRKIFQDQSFRLLHIDKNNKNILWLSTPTNLIKFNKQTDFTKSYGLSSGFLNMNFTAINEDDKGNLWLPSFTGLSRFNKNTERNHVYLEDEGLSNNEFNNYSTTTLKDGRIVFGTISGLTFVDADKLSQSTILIPDIQISNCKMLTSNLDSRKNITNQVKKSSKLSYSEKDIESTIQLANMEISYPK